MVTAGRALWRSLVHLYDESLMMIKANVVWFIGSIPFFLIVMIGSWVLVPPIETDEGPVIWPVLLSAFLTMVVPNPFSLGIYALASEVVAGETPEFALYWRTLRRLWKRGIVLYLIGAGVLVGLMFNTSFYLSLAAGWTQAISILWLYAMLFWITMQAYLGPLLFSSDESVSPSGVPLGTLYKRAAILTVANPILSLAIFLTSVLLLIISAIAIPIYPLIVEAYFVLVGSRALRELRLKYFPEEAETGEAAE
jgi:hypothetical protein